jgi:deazaflavin-dependent oxidoreductase (nitroreductase family)
MKDRFIQWFMAVNTWLLRISRGKIGNKLGSQTVLLLHTTGRKSGQERVVPIAYFHHEGRYLIVASNWGKDRQADWYLNLKHTPHAALEVEGETIPVIAHEAEGQEYQRLWQFATQRHPPYLDYQKMTARRIPIMVFEPGG